jgi:ribosomal protein S18 acetylase RimI-like enzyme
LKFEYAPLETAWVPITGDNYYYLYCLWVSGSYKGKGYGKSLMEYCLADAKEKGKSGIIIFIALKYTECFVIKARKEVDYDYYL